MIARMYVCVCVGGGGGGVVRGYMRACVVSVAWGRGSTNQIYLKSNLLETELLSGRRFGNEGNGRSW